MPSEDPPKPPAQAVSASPPTLVASEPRTFYQYTHSFAERVRLSTRLKVQYPDCIPVVFEPSEHVVSLSVTPATSRAELCLTPASSASPSPSPALSAPVITGESTTTTTATAAVDQSVSSPRGQAKNTDMTSEGDSLGVTWKEKRQADALRHDTTPQARNAVCCDKEDDDDGGGCASTADHVPCHASSPMLVSLSGATQPSVTPPTTTAVTAPAAAAGAKTEKQARREREARWSAVAFGARSQQRGLAIRFVLPQRKTLSEVIFILRNRLAVDPHQAVFLSIGNGEILAPSSSSLRELYEKYREDDGLLYVSYTLENTFG